jgi:hypothetical protein
MASKGKTTRSTRPAPERAGRSQVQSRRMAAGKPAAKTGRPLMSDKKPTEPEGTGDRNVDQIRDILFGGQMRDYERRFVELAQRLEQENARLRGEMEKRLAALEKRLDESSEKLARSVRQEIGDRGKACDDLENRVQQAARTARNEVNSAIGELQGSLDAADERERKALAELSASLQKAAAAGESALLAARTELRGEKVGREDLAALMAELALRLRGEFELPAAKK